MRGTAESGVEPTAVYQLGGGARLYDRGIVARHNARIHLNDVNDVLDGIEDEADKLLADLLAILDSTEIV
ncbi:hypothetical protein [Rhodococcus jostii]|uniref:Uncharacterized protein n=1 Tax=Rhodococcus jostii TaxID=132919 RepID=A0ABU4CLV8_RHOJO|nr:hypothetical protein [Rhodococcus jostii]MDV6284551.1 hypothetical protein [Rhodococcus jostii]